MTTMASTAKGSITLRGRFQDGTQVRVYDRVGDEFPSSSARGSQVKSGTPKAGELELDGLVPGASYWAVQEVDGEERHVRFVAHNQDRTDVPLVASSGQTDPKFGEQVRPAPPPGEVVTGARGTKDARSEYFENARKVTGKQQAHEPTAKEGLSVEQHPYPKVADTSSPLRSDTPMGEAHPVAKDELNPGLKQEDVSKGTWQRSDTPLGEATPVEPDEVQPAARQEDSGKVLQRSDTRTGSQEPIVDQSKPPDPEKPAEEIKAKPQRRQQRKSKPRKAKGKSTTKQAARKVQAVKKQVKR